MGWKETIVPCVNPSSPQRGAITTCTTRKGRAGEWLPPGQSQRLKPWLWVEGFDQQTVSCLGRSRGRKTDLCLLLSSSPSGEPDQMSEVKGTYWWGRWKSFPTPEQNEEKWGWCAGKIMGYPALPPSPGTTLSLYIEELRKWSWSLTSQNVEGSQGGRK